MYLYLKFYFLGKIPVLTRRLHLFDAKFGPHPLLYKDKYNLSIKQPERGKTIG